MKTNVFEIEKGIFKISIAPTDDFEYNQFLIIDKKCMLIHTGGMKIFQTLKKIVESLISLKELNYIAFSHFESDECGSLNKWLEISLNAVPLVGQIGKTTMEDFSCKTPKIIKDHELINLGEKNILVLETPHIPHNWEACLFFETTKGILFSSDLGAQPGIRIPVTKDNLTDIILNFQGKVGFIPEGKVLIETIQKLEKLNISYLATMHGSTLKGSSIALLFEALKHKFR